jgi:VWFA-related protein
MTRIHKAIGGSLVVLMPFIGLGAGATSQAPAFSSRVDIVRVDVSVRRNGRAVRGLTAEEFEVYDNRVRQQIIFVRAEETPINLVLALDMSDSLRGAGLAQLRAASARLVQMLEAGDTGALIVFTDFVTIRSSFTANVAALSSALLAPAMGPDTALIDAAYAAMVLGDSASGRPVVVVFSDGIDTASFLTAAAVLDTAKQTGSAVYAVATPQAGDGGFLDDLVRLTGGRRLSVASLDDLAETFVTILDESRDRYLLGYTPTGVSASGWHELRVTVRGGGAEVHARPGYLALR